VSPSMATKASQYRPSSSAEAIRRWRRLVKILQAGERPEPELVEWLTAATADYEDAAAYGDTLDRALGFEPAPGHLGWWTAEPLERRDQLVRELHQKFFADLTIAAAARAIVREGKEIEARGLHRGASDQVVNERRTLFVSLGRVD
jgi:hypothetical protein